jgi:hypothetical protein
VKNVIFRLFIIAFLALYVQLIQAEELIWHGFAAQGVIQSADSNFVNDDGAISLSLTEVGMNTSYRISNKLRVSAQGVYINGGNRYDEGLHIDYLFLDYQLLNSNNWQLNVNLGRYKNYHWLYSSTRDVPHTMPTNVLPQSIYFDALRHISLGSDGISMAAHNLNSFGEWDFRWSYGQSKITRRQTVNILSELATGRLSHDYDTQMSVAFRPLGSGASVGLSVLDDTFTYTAGEGDRFIDTKANIQRIMLNFSLSGEYWEVNAEFLRERIKASTVVPEIVTSDTFSEGAYLQGQYFVSPTFTLLARADIFDLDVKDRSGIARETSSGGYIPRYFGYMDLATVAAAWDFSSNWRVRAEYHRVKGRARLAPLFVADLVTNDSEYWDIWAVQVIYWF